MSDKRVFLDNNSTTTIDKEVVKRIAAAMALPAANPASQHAFGRDARKRLEYAKDVIGRLAGARQADIYSDQLIVTSGGTEANNLAILGATGDSPIQRKGTIIVSSIEHPSVLEAAEKWKKLGGRIETISANQSGQIEIQSLEQIFAVTEPSDIRLISVMTANNETGVVQPLDKVIAVANEHGVPVHSDAVQAFGKIPIDFCSAGLSAMTITAHKLHGPVGVGLLVARHDRQFDPQLFGGQQQLGIRPGIEPVSLIEGFAKAAELSHENIAIRAQHLKKLRLIIEEVILEEVPNSVLIGHDSPRLPHTACIAFPGRNRQSLQMALDMRGIACGTGSACASGSNQPSTVLTAMKLDNDVIDSAMRFSVAHYQSEALIHGAAKKIAEVANRRSTIN